AEHRAREADDFLAPGRRALGVPPDDGVLGVEILDGRPALRVGSLEIAVDQIDDREPVGNRLSHRSRHVGSAGGSPSRRARRTSRSITLEQARPSAKVGASGSAAPCRTESRIAPAHSNICARYVLPCSKLNSSFAWWRVWSVIRASSSRGFSLISSSTPSLPITVTRFGRSTGLVEVASIAIHAPRSVRSSAV